MKPKDAIESDKNSSRKRKRGCQHINEYTVQMERNIFL